MAFRSDIWIDWDLSPRIIYVPSSSTELDMQDLVDTCRQHEVYQTNMDNDYLITAAGKDPLGGGVYVGLTVSLLNAQVAFEARSGPGYTQCNLAGGNLVAYTATGAELNPVYPTAFTQVVRTSSSSATLQELLDIQYSSFGGGVTVDKDDGVSGTTYPTGTPRQPVNNLTDAMSIAGARGFTHLYVRGDLTVDNSGDYSDMTFVGESMTKSTLWITTGANVSGAEFSEAEVLGTLDGNAHLSHCLIGNLNYIYGVIEQCLLEAGTITLGGGNEAYFLDCWCGSTTTLPEIDMGGSGQSLALRSYSGGVKIKNKTGPETACITLAEGRIEIDSTVTAGLVQVVGVGQIEDNSAGATVDTTHLIGKDSIQSYIWNATAADFTGADTMGALMDHYVHALLKNADMSGDILRIWKDDGMTQIWRKYDLASGGRVRTYP
jgi:uncharacterized protein YjbI with pentapeptide repeats